MTERLFYSGISPSGVKPIKELKKVLPSPLSEIPPNQMMNAVISGKAKTMHVEAMNMNKIEDGSC